MSTETMHYLAVKINVMQRVLPCYIRILRLLLLLSIRTIYNQISMFVFYNKNPSSIILQKKLFVMFLNMNESRRYANCTFKLGNLFVSVDKKNTGLLKSCINATRYKTTSSHFGKLYRIFAHTNNAKLILKS